MQKFISLALFLVLVGHICNAQQIYSVANLNQASQEELAVYLEKAQKLKKTGKTLSITGPVCAASGVIIAMTAWNNELSEEMFVMGLLMFLGGTGVTVVGLPIMLSASSRIKRINDIKGYNYGGVSLDLRPSTQYNLITNNPQPGITLRIRF